MNASHKKGLCERHEYVRFCQYFHISGRANQKVIFSHFCTYVIKVKDANKTLGVNIFLAGLLFTHMLFAPFPKHVFLQQQKITTILRYCCFVDFLTFRSEKTVCILKCPSLSFHDRVKILIAGLIK